MIPRIWKLDTIELRENKAFYGKIMFWTIDH